MAQRNWLGTLNNPEHDTKEWLEKLYKAGKAVYVCGQLEKGAEGTPHIQYFVNFDKSQRLSFCKKLCSKSHWEPIKVNNGAHDYCMKQETRLEGPYEFGKKPVQRNNKADWEEVKTAAIEGKWEKVPAEIYIKHFQNLQKINAFHSKTGDAEQCRGIWLWGPPGTGKTTFARTEYDDPANIYIKAQNKWWDGYQGQKVVVLDDLDNDCLHHYLKIWADKWGCRGEIKGSTVALTYEKFVVTSNYSIKELFKKHSPEMVEAIERRFKVTYFEHKDFAPEEYIPVIRNRKDAPALASSD